MNSFLLGMLRTLSGVFKHAFLYMFIFWILGLYYNVYSIALSGILIGYVVSVIVCELFIRVLSRKLDISEKIDSDD